MRRDVGGGARRQRATTSTLESLVILSQDVHRIFGGVVPEIASRAHLTAIVPVVERALADAGGRRRDRRGRGDECAGARRRAARRRELRQGVRLRARDSGDRRASHGGASVRDGARASRRGAAVHRAARLRRTHAAARRRGVGPLPAARPHARRRGRRGVRQSCQAARPSVSWRPARRAARRERARPDDVPLRAADAATRSEPGDRRLLRCLVQRAQDRGAQRREVARTSTTSRARDRARVSGRARRHARREDGARRAAVRPRARRARRRRRVQSRRSSPRCGSDVEPRGVAGLRALARVSRPTTRR